MFPNLVFDYKELGRSPLYIFPPKLKLETDLASTSELLILNH
jgi:hypothetical protein